MISRKTSLALIATLALTMGSAWAGTDYIADFTAATNAITGSDDTIGGNIKTDATGNAVAVEVASGAKLTVTGGNTFTIEGVDGTKTGTLNNSGTMVIANTAALTAAANGTINNNGIMEVLGGGTLNKGAGAFTNTGGMLILGGTVTTDLVAADVAGGALGLKDGAQAKVADLMGSGTDVQIYDNLTSAFAPTDTDYNGTVYTGDVTALDDINVAKGTLNIGGVHSDSGITPGTNVSVSADAITAANVTVDNSVVNDVTVNGVLSVTGNVTTNGADLTANSIAGGNTANINVGAGILTVHGATTAASITSTGTTVTLDGTTNLSGALTASGAVNTNGNDLTVGSIAGGSAAINVGAGILTVNGDTNAASITSGGATVTLDGTTNLSGALTASGAVTTNGNNLTAGSIAGGGTATIDTNGGNLTAGTTNAASITANGGTVNLGLTNLTGAFSNTTGDSTFTDDAQATSFTTTNGNLNFNANATTTTAAGITATGTGSITILGNADTSTGDGVISTTSGAIAVTGTTDTGTGNITSTSGNMTFTGAILSAGTISSTGGTMAFGNAVNVSGAITNTTGNMTFAGTVDGATMISSASGNMTFADNVGTGTAVTDMNIGSGIATFTGGKTVTVTSVITATGGTFATTGTGTVTVTNGLNVAGGTLQIGANTAGTDLVGITGDVAMSNSTTISVAGYSNTGVTQNIITGTITGFADDAALQTYLTGQNYNSMLGTYEFTGTLAGGVGLDFAAATGSARDRFNVAAAGLGFGDISDGASDSYIGAVQDAVEAIVNGPSNATNATGTTTEQILAALGGEANNGYDFAANNAAGRAAYQGTTGKVFANSIHVATDTVSRHIDMANYNLNNLSLGELPGFGQASIQSANGLASYTVNCGDYANRIWLGGFGMWDDVDTRKNDGGYKYNSYGAIVGMDRTFGGAITVGASFAATLGDYKDKQVLSNDSDIDTYSGNLYAQFKSGSGFFGRIMGGYAYTDDEIDIRYTLADRERADYHVSTWSVGGALGYELKASDCFTLTPSVGLYYYNSESNKFDSNTKTGVKLDYDRLEMPVDLVASYAIVNSGDSKLALNVNVGYAYNFNDNTADGNFTYTGLPGSVYVESRDNGRHTYKAGGGFKYESGNFDFGVNYDYRHKAKSDSHSVFATVGLKF